MGGEFCDCHLNHKNNATKKEAGIFFGIAIKTNKAIINRYAVCKYQNHKGSCHNQSES